MTCDFCKGAVQEPILIIVSEIGGKSTNFYLCESCGTQAKDKLKDKIKKD